MKKRKRQVIRIMAIVLVLLMVLGVIVSGLVTALGETQQERSACDMTIEYMEQEQALHITQRLLYYNPSETDSLRQVVFYAAPNMFRRESALMYEAEDLDAVFPNGYIPGGIEIQRVCFNGETADWGMQGENEMFLRADCNIPAGGSGMFEFEYYLLLTDNCAFIGTGDEGVRLSGFYLIPGVYNEQYREFNLNQPISHTRWVSTQAMDYSVDITLPPHYEPAATGIVEKTGDNRWRIEAENIREFALAFGKKYRTQTERTESGVEIVLMASSRSGQTALDSAMQAIEQCERWFGHFPLERLMLVETDYRLGALNFPGLVFLPEEFFKDEKRMKSAIRFCMAQQYFGLSAFTEPVSDAWLSDSICEYLSYLLLEASEGHDAFLDAINRDWLPSLQLTIPGGMTVTSSAAIFTKDEYDIVVRKRGAAVIHELRLAMGLEPMLTGLANFYEMGLDGHTLTEMELVQALNAADGRSWEAFLTDWVFNIGDYVNQSMDYYE